MHFVDENSSMELIVCFKYSKLHKKTPEYSERNKKVVIASDSEAIQTFEIASGYRPRNDICL